MEQGFETYSNGAIGEVRLTRSATRNALRAADKRGIEEAIHAFERAEETKVVVLTSSDPRAFCSGTDIAEMAGMSTEEAVQMFDVERAMYESILESPLPVIAAIEGAALGGGCVLATCTDLSIAGQAARFAMPEIYLGVPAPLQTALLPQIVGLTRARRMLLLGETLDAAEAFAIGLVSEVADNPSERAFEIAAQLARLSSAGIRSQKRMMNAWISGEHRTAVSLSSFVAASALTEEGAQEAIEGFVNRKAGKAPTNDR